MERSGQPIAPPFAKSPLPFLSRPQGVSPPGTRRFAATAARQRGGCPNHARSPRRTWLLGDPHRESPWKS
jgi:hypothetical protein